MRIYLQKPAKTVSIISNFLLKDQVLTPVGLLTRFKTVRTNISTEEIIVLVPATVQFLSDAKLLKKNLTDRKIFHLPTCNPRAFIYSLISII